MTSQLYIMFSTTANLQSPIQLFVALIVYVLLKWLFDTMNSVVANHAIPSFARFTRLFSLKLPPVEWGVAIQQIIQILLHNLVINNLTSKVNNFIIYIQIQEISIHRLCRNRLTPVEYRKLLETTVQSCSQLRCLLHTVLVPDVFNLK